MTAELRDLHGRRGGGGRSTKVEWIRRTSSCSWRGCCCCSPFIDSQFVSVPTGLTHTRWSVLLAYQPPSPEEGLWVST